MKKPYTKAMAYKLALSMEEDHPHLIVKKDAKLGYYIYDADDEILPFSYNYIVHKRYGTYTNWVSAGVFKRRQKIGHNVYKRKPKQIMRGDIFSLDDIELAEKLMAEM